MMDYKLGKAPARRDPRTLKLKTVLKIRLPSIPAAFDIDKALGLEIPTPMYANDRYGDCVIAGRAHQTLRLEGYEQNKILPIREQDVTEEYFIQTGGADSGLYLLNSLNDWRNDGWEATSEVKVSRKILCLPSTTKYIRRRYTIYAYGAVDPKDQDDARACIYLLGGLYTGLLLPLSAQSQAVWDVDESENGRPGSWGGHCVYIMAYDEQYLTCVTWGYKQKMTWEFLIKYCDEAFGVIDNKDNWLGDASPLDIPLLESYLESIKN